MYLLYLDDAGKIDDPTQQYAVLAGISVFERATHWVAQEMDSIAQKYFPAHSIEFHGSPMRSGSGMWRRINKEARFSAIKECLNIIALSDHSLATDIDPTDLSYSPISWERINSKDDKVSRFKKIVHGLFDSSKNL